MPTIEIPAPTATLPASDLLDASSAVAVLPERTTARRRTPRPSTPRTAAAPARTPETSTADRVRAMAEAARRSAAEQPPFSSERAYWTGVEAAAEQVLHPERAAVSQVGWMYAMHPEFVSAYVQTVSMLAPVWSARRERRTVTASAS